MFLDIRIPFVHFEQIMSPGSWDRPIVELEKGILRLIKNINFVFRAWAIPMAISVVEEARPKDSHVRQAGTSTTDFIVINAGGLAAPKMVFKGPAKFTKDSGFEIGLVYSRSNEFGWVGLDVLDSMLESY